MIVKVVLLCIFHYFISKFIQHIRNYAFNVHIVRECQYLLWRRPSLPLSALLLCRLDMLRRLCLCLCLAPALHSPHLVPSNTCTLHWTPWQFWPSLGLNRSATNLRAAGFWVNSTQDRNRRARQYRSAGWWWSGYWQLHIRSCLGRQSQPSPALQTCRQNTQTSHASSCPHRRSWSRRRPVLSWCRDVNSGEKTIDPSILEQLSNF